VCRPTSKTPLHAYRSRQGVRFFVFRQVTLLYQ